MYNVKEFVDLVQEIFNVEGLQTKLEVVYNEIPTQYGVKHEYNLLANKELWCNTSYQYSEDFRKESLQKYFIRNILYDLMFSIPTNRTIIKEDGTPFINFANILEQINGELSGKDIETFEFKEELEFEEPEELLKYKINLRNPKPEHRKFINDKFTLYFKEKLSDNFGYNIILFFNNENIFSGYIKNRNDFRKLTQQLRIDTLL